MALQPEELNSFIFLKPERKFQPKTSKIEIKEENLDENLKIYSQLASTFFKAGQKNFTSFSS